jgi:4-diphosphocytidyl-2-C-methyl-D-erythritol kinase
MKIERALYHSPSMHSPNMASHTALTCHVPCKINLFLEVLGKRADGYHDLDTVMLAVDVCDTLSIQPRTDSDIRLQIDYPSDESAAHEYPIRFAIDDPAWNIPADERNLVVRALRRLQVELGTTNGFDALLSKRIPAQAGLGGGSADAAAALVLGSLAWSGRLQLPLLSRIAAEMGSDLNFFLEGWSNRCWTAHCSGRGEKVTPVANPADQHVVIVHPPQGCDTGEIFRNLTDQPPQTTQTSKSPPGNSAELLHWLARGQNEQVGPLLYNRLDQVARARNPWIDRTAKWFDRYKPLGQCLSGSGSARFCLCSSRQEAEKIGRELALLNECRVFVASTWRTSSIQEQIQPLGFIE